MSVRALKIGFAAALAASVLASFSANAGAAGTLYTNNYNAKQLAALSIGSDGLLTPLNGSPFEVADYLDGLAITPDGRTMVTSFGFDNLLGTLSLGTGGIPASTGSPFAAEIGGGPAITPDGRFAYIPTEPGGLSAYAIGAGGSLTRIGSTFGSAGGNVPAVTPDGHFVFDPDPSGNAVERFAIQPDGSLVSLGSTPAGAPTNVIRVTPDGRFAIVHGYSPSRLATFSIGSNGSLTPVGSPLETVGAVSGAPVISPNGTFVYIANGNEQSITTYSISGTGVLSQVGTPIGTGMTQVEGLGMSVDGRFLYAEPQSGEVLQAFSVGNDGTLTKIGGLAPTGGFSDGEMPTARPSAPVAAFTAQAGPPHGKTTFDASASSDTWAKVASYSWEFGDGSKLTTASPQASHTYADPGVYAVRLSVTDDNGCSGFSYTGQTAYCSGRGATTSVDTLPVILGMTVTSGATNRVSSSRRKKPKRRPVVHYKLSEAANVSFTVLSKRKGRKAGKACKPTKGKGKGKKPNCALLKSIGSFSAIGSAGKNKTPLPGKLNGRPLAPGSYVLSAVATDSAGGNSAPRTAGFKTKKKPKKHPR